MTGIEARDPVALEAALEALPEGCWLEVTVADERFLVVRVNGGWHLPGDLTVTSGDVADGEPSKVEVLGDDGYLPVEVAIREARAEFARARAADDWSAAEALTRELDDLDAVGCAEAGELRDQIAAWLGLFGDDPDDLPNHDTDSEALALLADLDSDEASGLAEWTGTRRRQRCNGRPPQDGT